METLTFNTIILDNNTCTPNNFSRIAFAVNLAKTRPGPQELGIPNLDKIYFMLSAERLDELEIFRFCTGLNKDAQMCLPLIQGLGTLTQAASKTIMYEGVLQNLLIKVKRCQIIE